MPHENRVVTATANPRIFRTLEGYELPVPSGWALLEPGDATLTRRVKQGGTSWKIEQKQGRRTISLGILADAGRIERVRAELAAERDTPAYRKKLAASRARREREQESYVEDFGVAVRAFLRFAPVHAAFERELAAAVTAHATPVGSGTVARTRRIPVEQRAEAAVIAWMRHHTTAYEQMHIARVKGRRRSVRRQLAAESKRLLQRYRDGGAVDAGCPLAAALNGRQGGAGRG